MSRRMMKRQKAKETPGNSLWWLDARLIQNAFKELRDILKKYQEADRRCRELMEPEEYTQMIRESETE